MVDLMGHEYRRDGTVRDTALSLLAETLTVSGLDGEHYRAVIAPRIAFLRHVAPRWVEEHREQLSGDGAPGNLGQATIDLALFQGVPDRWLLEHFRHQVRDAVRRATGNALDYYLLAMLWHAPGYSVNDTLTFLRSHATLSDAGQALGRLLRSKDSPAHHVALAAPFWEKAMTQRTPENLAGFGCYAEIHDL